MPIGFIIRSDEAAAVERIFAGREVEGAPVIENNLFEFSPRFGLRILTMIQNADLDEAERVATTRLIQRLGEYLGANHASVLFEPPVTDEPEQFVLFEEGEDEREEA